MVRVRPRTLRDTAVVGTGEGTVLTPAPAAGVLALAPYNLAVRGARLDKDEAILGELDGKNLGLLVEKPGKHLVTVDWSARGDLETGDLRFKLDVPPCGLTSFELELPVDRVIDVSRRDKCLLSGPLPSAVAPHHRWRLDC